MATIFIDGEAGTTGLQIRDKLAGVSGVKLASLPAEARKDPAAKRKLYGDVDVVILCLPDEAAKEAAHLIDAMGDRGSARHRRLLGAPGRARLDLRVPRADRRAGRGGRQGRKVTNPGCHATGAIALLRPLVDAGAASQGNGPSRSARSAAIRAAASR